MSNKSTLPTIERRYTSGSVQLRAKDDEEDKDKSRVVRGYAAKYKTKSDNLGTRDYEFFEVIEPGAFDDVLNEDVRALFNHDANQILARSKGGKGTLRLGVDDTGLWYEFEAPDTRAGNDLLVSLRRGDVDQSSFAFTVSKDGQEWAEVRTDEKTTVTRTIKKVERLFDVSPVTYPAYADTSVSVRALAEHYLPKQEPAQNFSVSDRERRLRVLQLSSL